MSILPRFIEERIQNGPSYVISRKACYSMLFASYDECQYYCHERILFLLVLNGIIFGGVAAALTIKSLFKRFIKEDDVRGWFAARGVRCDIRFGLAKHSCSQ
jgi:hypothetical protein